MKIFTSTAASFVALSTLLSAVVSAETWKVVPRSDNTFTTEIFDGNKTAFTATVVGWGPKWNPYFAPSSTSTSMGNELRLTSPLQIGGATATIRAVVKPAGPRDGVFTYTVDSAGEIPIQSTVVSLSLPTGAAGEAQLTSADGTQQTVKLPISQPSQFGTAQSITLKGNGWSGPVRIDIDPPAPISGDGDLRIALATGKILAGSHATQLAWHFSADSEMLLSTAAQQTYAPVIPQSDWFAFRPTYDFKPSVIGMENWLEKPAGKHGGVRITDDSFAFEDGTPVKFWGMDVSYCFSAPDKKDAEFTAARYAKYGVNAVRMHKFLNPGWEGIGSDQSATQNNPEALDKFDYLTSQFEQHGVYFGWSHSYHFKIQKGDRDRVAGFDELMAAGGDTYAVMNWAEDVQDVMIGRVIDLLKHKNPYTGKRYAEDPALCYVELQNEDDIFFFSSAPALQQFPTYRRQLMQRFAEWLRDKYGSQEKLAGAWGSALHDGEQIETASIVPELNPWLSSSDHLPMTQEGDRQRLLDNAAFLHATQDRFYSKFTNAIRDTGYQGPLVGSPWQAPSQLPHYYNLKSDADVGYVDRHDYFSGAFNASMLAKPGGGYLSAGLQQVANRPFGMSEWIHVFPSLYSAEGPVLMAAYGMGLQGWDASYEFQSTTLTLDSGAALVSSQYPWGIWNADLPTQIGQYPILARMIQRGDVKEAPVISVRRVSPDDLQSGEFNFKESITLQGDVKTFAGSTPVSSLAAGRDLVEFVKSPAASTLPDMSRYTHGTTIESATGQLKWDTDGGGMVTINTAGTQGYVGFAQGKHIELGDLTINAGSPYASLLVTAAALQSDLAHDDRALLCAVARNANQGLRVLTLNGTSVVDPGRPPVMLEPVKATLQFKRAVECVNVLDDDGQPTGTSITPHNGTIDIDTGRDGTMYYEVIFAH